MNDVDRRVASKLYQQDPYMIEKNLFNRLYTEYKTHGKLIIAIDFDDTVYDTHENGWEYERVLSTLRKWQNHAYIICWTASLPERYDLIRKHFEDNGVHLDAINENHPDIPDRGPKIYANIYLDDRSCGLALGTLILNDLYSRIMKERLDYHG